MTRAILWGGLIAAAGVATPFLIFACRQRALRQPASHRPIGPAERAAVRAQGRLSVMGFIVFWIVAPSLIFFAELSGTPEPTQWALFFAIILIIVVGGGLHLQIRCPSCNYRLGYQRNIGVPSHCERCGAEL